MDEKELLLHKYNQALQAHAQAVDSVFELKYLLQKAEAQIADMAKASIQVASAKNVSDLKK